MKKLISRLRSKLRRLFLVRPNLQSALDLPSAHRSILMQPGNGFGAKETLYRSAEAQLASIQNLGDSARPLESVQVLTRYCSIERPYWSSFVDHYQSLGVQRIDVCVQSQSEYKELLCFQDTHGVELSIHLLSDKLDPSISLRTLNLDCLQGTAEWTLLADCDEYMQILNPGITAMKLISLYPAVSQFYIPWLMSPTLTLPNNFLGGFWGHIGKPMVRSDKLIGIASDHSFYTSKSFCYDEYSSCPLGSLGVALVHFWSRSFRDCLLKTFSNRFQDSKSADLSKALLLIRNGKLPNRLKLLAYLLEQQNYIFLQKYPKLSVDADIEESLVRQFISEKDESICFELFMSYRARLSLEVNRIPLYPAISLLEIVECLPD